MNTRSRWSATALGMVVLTGLTLSGTCSPAPAVASLSLSADGQPSETLTAALPPTSFSTPLVASVMDALEAEFKRDVIARARRAHAVYFQKKATPVGGGRVGAAFSLEDVQYTSSTEAAAEFYNCHRVFRRVCTTIIATTQDNWAHTAGLAINEDLADLVSYLPLGRGAVAIKAEDQSSPRSYPPFVLYPDGKVTPLHVSHEPRAVAAGTELLPDNFAFGEEIGLGAWMLGADVDAAEIFGLPPLPPKVNGMTYEDVPGREGLVNVSGYHRNSGDEVWRFSESTDNARTWRSTDVRLPWGDRGNGGRCWPACGIYRYTDDYQVAVGPGHFQALALTDVPEDLPDYLRQLWLTDDEKAFRRVSLPWDRMAFGGMAFASDGALLVSEAKDPLAFCTDICRPGRIWRLPPGGTEPKPLADAPRLSSRGRIAGMYDAGGGMIVAHTGKRTIAVSTDGYTWTEVTPGV